MAEYIERTEELMLAMNAGARAIETRSVITVLFTPTLMLLRWYAARIASTTTWVSA